MDTTKHPLFETTNPFQIEIIDKIDEMIAEGHTKFEIDVVAAENAEWDKPRKLFAFNYIDWCFHDETSAEVLGYVDPDSDEFKMDFEPIYDFNPEKRVFYEPTMDTEKYKQYAMERVKVLEKKLGSVPGGVQLAELASEASKCAVINLERTSRNMPPLPRVNHACIVGSPGAGLLEAARDYAEYCYRLGLVQSSSVEVVSLTGLVGQTVSSEADNTYAALANSDGGTLIFRDAHELNNPHRKHNDTGVQILQTLEGALDDDTKHWMLLLIGEASGIEALLSTHPRLMAHIPRIVYMKDFAADELMGEVQRYCKTYDLTLTEGAETRLKALLAHAGNKASSHSYYVQNLFSDKILPRLNKRLDSRKALDEEALRVIEAEDIPSFSYQESEALKELDAMVGLGEVKTRLRDFLQVVKLADRRRTLGLTTNMPRLHMAFLGNPGTGKTTVASIVGRVLASWGFLSRGQVICTEKSELVGEYRGETEVKMRDLIARAKGNVLFIDEAYQLIDGTQGDPGRIVLDSLLTLLGSENLDMVVILAGYTAPMKRLLKSNEGISSRFPNVFKFEDYTPDQLVEIGRQMLDKQGFTMTEAASEKLRSVIEEEASKPSPLFGNGRYVANLLQNEVFASVSRRVDAMKNPRPADLQTILPEDIVVDKQLHDVVFDDVAIDQALARLDSLAGLQKVKTAIHNFVNSTRYLHDNGRPYVGKGMLSWRFVGNTGTGKSTVAEVMAAILKGMHLIANSNITQIKSETIFNVSPSECDSVLTDAFKRSCNGLIFIDADNPHSEYQRNAFSLVMEQVRLKMAAMAQEIGGECALILADCEAPHQSIVENMAESGIYEFDHTIVFDDYTAEELFEILASCLKRFDITFNTAAGKHMQGYIEAMVSSSPASANARTMKLMSRSISQQVTLREATTGRMPRNRQVQLADVAMFKWNKRKGRIGY